ncbi:MAG: Tyrosine recombinase XerC, partial [Parcubacteria group bacterium GW2011_GWF2_50_9]
MSPDAMLAGFMQHLRVERGLSPCTWTSYGYQIRGYMRFLAGRGLIPVTATREDVLAYLEARRDARLASSSLFAAAITIRQFHRFLADSRIREDNPVELLESPRLPRKIPRAASYDTVDGVLAIIDENEPTGLGYRDRTMFELIYSCGLRVSEACSLEV